MSMTMDEAVLRLRRDPKFAELIRDSYLEADTHACAERFRQLGEFREVQRLLGSLSTGVILDLGAGTGIASYAFSTSGARLVYALEPNHSDIVGSGAIRRLTQGMTVEPIEACGEKIPLPDSHVDVVYSRQVLHHTQNLNQVLRECARVLKPGGIFLACREHVVDNELQLRAFRQQHPFNQLVGGEQAFPLDAYLDAIRLAGLQLQNVFGPWDTVINAFPGVKEQTELSHYPQQLLAQRLGRLGAWAGTLPMVRSLVWKWLKRPVPGRLYTFLAGKS